MNSEHFATLACYNSWANHRLYQACEGLREEEYMRDRPSSHGSLHALLNHLLVVDRVWIARIEGRAMMTRRLDQILYADLIGLKVARSAEDARLRHLVTGLTSAMLDQSMSYRDPGGNRQQILLRVALAHLFNHQAEHRGEALALLSQAGATPPSLDLTRFIREYGAAPIGSPVASGQFHS